MKQRSIKKLAAVLMLLSFIFAAVTPAMAGGLKTVDQLYGGQGGGTAKPGETLNEIYFGNYRQSYSGTGATDVKESYNYEGIKWRVLTTNAPLDYTDTSSNKGIFLMSDQGLYADAFGSGKEWCTSEIRATLTGLNAGESSTAKTYGELNTISFAHDAFNAKEYAAIADTTHTAGGGYVGCGIVSTDKIFLLNTFGDVLESPDEAMNENYGFSFFSNPTDTRIAPATGMAQNVTMYGNSSTVYVDGGSYWWLRSPGYNTDNNASCIYCDGDVFDLDVSYDMLAVRPALNLNQDNVLFLSAATGGKGNVNIGDGFTLADNSTTGWKLTLYDKYSAANTNGIKAPTGVNVTQESVDGLKSKADTAAAQAAGSRVMDLTNGYQIGWLNPKVTYNGKDTNADYVSAIAADGDGNYVNYAKISSQTDETNKEVDLYRTDSTLADGEYKMYVYAEKIGLDENGSTDYQTDYASELSEGFTIHKGTEQKNEGVLAKSYADKGLTANLGNNFKLGFESAKYDTKVSVGTGNGEVFGGATIAELNANENTTVTGFVNATTATIATDKQITTNGAFVSDKFVAIGQGAVVNSAATNSVALGSGSVADEADTVSVGNSTTQRKIVNVADGSIETGSHEAVTGSQLNATNIAVATNTADITTLKSNFETDGTTAKMATKAAQDASGNVIADTYATKTTVNDLDTRVEAAETSIGNINNTLSGKADASSVYTKDETYTKTEVDAMIGSGGVLAVNYKDNTKAEIELMGADGTTISNVKAVEPVSENDNYAATTGQLYKTNQNVEANKTAIDEINDSAVMKSGITSEKVAKYDGYEAEIANKANKATTLVGYGITDAYTKDEVDRRIASGGIEVIEGKKYADNDKKATATGKGAIAVGYNNEAAGIKSTAVGYGNIVKGNGSGAFGDPNVISGNGSYAVGNNNTIEGHNNFVLGSNVKIGKGVKNTVAFGSLDPEKEMTVTESNTVAVGGRTISGLAEGTKPTDAATYGQLTRLAGTAGQAIAEETSRAQTTERYLQSEISANTQELREVGAISAALAGLHYVEPSGEEGDKFVGAVAYGNYRGESAGAIGIAYKPNPNFMLSASTSVGQNQNAYNAGMSLKFGKGETAQTRAELKKQVKYLNEKSQAQDAENAALKDTVAQQGNTIAQQGMEIQTLKSEIVELKKLIKK